MVRGQMSTDVRLDSCLFFVVLAELATSLLVLDGFDQHFQATVHTSKQGRRLTQQHQSYFSKNNSELSREKKTLGTLRLKPWPAWWEARTLPLCYANPLDSCLYVPTIFSIPKCSNSPHLHSSSRSAVAQ